ncbi:MAG: hypothetical protein EOQ42_33510 [Mesorhizobium sp.]|nr:MAG: hypothetical protein EOQ42_33510 [Mesorhizobium sp.]
MSGPISNEESEKVRRVHCVVPFCRRTRKPGCSEWICGPHWLGISVHLRRRKSRLDRRYRRLFGNNGFWTYPPGSPPRLQAVKLDRLCDLAWDRCKRAAIERAAGI